MYVSKYPRWVGIGVWSCVKGVCLQFVGVETWRLKVTTWTWTWTGRSQEGAGCSCWSKLDNKRPCRLGINSSIASTDGNMTPWV